MKFDSVSARAAKDQAMNAVEINANEEWKALMYDLIIKTAKAKKEFTADDVFELFYALPEATRPFTHEPRAFGPVMRNAAKNGVCEMTDRVVNSNRVSLHSSPIRIWRSLLRKGK